MAGRPAQSVRAPSVAAARCALLSTVALLASVVVHGSARALFAFIWVVLALAAMAFQWNARRLRAREAHAPRSSPAPRSSRPPLSRAGGPAKKRRSRRA